MPLSSHMLLLLEMIVACFPSGRILGVYRPPPRCSCVHILQSPLLNSMPTLLRPDSAASHHSLHLDFHAARILVSWQLLLARIKLHSSRSLYFPPRFASRKRTFFLTVFIHSPISSGSQIQSLPDFPELLTDRVILEHAERAVGARAAESHEEARQGHRHEAYCDGS